MKGLSPVAQIFWCKHMAYKGARQLPMMNSPRFRSYIPFAPYLDFLTRRHLREAHRGRCSSKMCAISLAFFDFRSRKDSFDALRGPLVVEVADSVTYSRFECLEAGCALLQIFLGLVRGLTHTGHEGGIHAYISIYQKTF